MSNHTPGPWATSRECPKIIKLAPDNLGESNVLISSAHGHPGSGFFPSEEEAIANARLISAAPDLLAALISERQLRQLGQEPNVHWESLRETRGAACSMTEAAIAKATGKCPTT